MSGAKGVGIPDGSKDAYDATASVPNTDGFEDYLNRGYSTLQNLAANVILKMESGEDGAQIAMFATPMPANNDETDPFE